MPSTALADHDTLIARIGQYEAALYAALVALDAIHTESGQHHERLVLARITLGGIKGMSRQVLDFAQRLGIDTDALQPAATPAQVQP